MTKKPGKKPHNSKKLVFLVVVILAAYIGYRVADSLRHRLAQPAPTIEEVGDKALENLQTDAGKVGFEEAQKRAQERGNEKLNNLQGHDRVVAAAIGFLSIEYKLAEGYEIYCKQHGTTQMPQMKNRTYELNKAPHGKALSILQAAGISQADVENNILMPLEPQLMQAIDMEISSVAKKDNKTNADVCKELERTAPQNQTLDIKLQNPGIVDILEKN